MSDAYNSACSAAAFIDRSDRVRIGFSGAKAVDTLNGLFTNDVPKLKPGSGHYAAALTNKGKVVADVRVFAVAERFVVDTSAAAGPGFLTMIRKYVNPRLATYRDLSGETGTLGVFGPAAASAIAAVAGLSAADLTSLDQFEQASMSFGDSFAARVPDLGVVGFDLFAPREHIETIRSQLQGAGAAELDASTADILRIEAGRPLWGTDMDENTLAQEAALDRADLGAISFDKGCYTGQETVARVHFRGHVNRILRGLRAGVPLDRGATLHGADGTQVGDVRSTALSPRFGPIALAYVRREIADGAGVTVRWHGTEATATVVPLPFA